MSGHDDHHAAASDGGHPHAEGYPDARKRNVGLAALLAFLFGGVALFYVLPWRRALLWTIVTAAIDVASLGMLVVPVHMTCMLAATYFARMSLPTFTFEAGTTGEEYDRSSTSVQPHPPHTYFRIRQGTAR